jgi:hypothetical protein
LEDFAVMNNALDIRRDILRELEEIRNKFLQEDPDFNKQIASERKLQDE